MPRDPLLPASLASTAPRSLPTPALSPGDTRRIGARIIAWWQRRLRRREERLSAAALGALSPHLVRDIGAHDELTLRALALQESQSEHLARTSTSAHTLMGQLGRW